MNANEIGHFRLEFVWGLFLSGGSVELGSSLVQLEVDEWCHDCPTQFTKLDSDMTIPDKI